MKSCRIHITGASGAGVTSLGRALADALAISHHDADDYLWRPTTPPYRVTRAPADRLRLMREMFLERADWVLSGSLAGWGDPIIPLFDLVIFLYAPSAVRLRRLRAREARHFGADAVAVGGWRHLETEKFHRVGVTLRRRRCKPKCGTASSVACCTTVPSAAPRRNSAATRSGQGNLRGDLEAAARMGGLL